LCIKLVIEISLYSDGRSKKHQNISVVFITGSLTWISPKEKKKKNKLQKSVRNKIHNFYFKQFLFLVKTFKDKYAWLQNAFVLTLNSAKSINKMTTNELGKINKKSFQKCPSSWRRLHVSVLKQWSLFIYQMQLHQ
jgi:phage anti-repressor protein